MFRAATLYRACAVLALVLPPASRVRADGESDREGRRGLEASPASLDFGEVGHGETVRRSLSIRNTSEKPVRIRSARASCGCTRLERAIDGQTIPAGGAIEVGVTMSSGRAIGSLDKHLTIETEDGTRLDVGTRLRVFPDVRLGETPEPFAGEVDGNPCVRTYEIFSRSGRDFDLEIEKIVTGFGRTARNDPDFKAQVEPIRGGKKVVVTLLPTHPEGRVSGTVEARLDGKPFHIAFAGEVFRGIRVSPRYLQFNRVETGKGAEAPVVRGELVAIDGRPFRVLKTEVILRRGAAGAEWKATARERKEGREYEVELRLIPPKESATGSFHGALRIETDHPEKPVVEFGILGFFPTRREPASPEGPAGR